MLGLTVGIILSMTLVSHFHKAQQRIFSPTEIVVIPSALGVGASDRISAESSKMFSEKDDVNKTSVT